MNKRAAVIIAITSTLLLAGCAGVDLVQAGKPADLGDGITVTPTTAWAKVYGGGAAPLLTIHGVGLGELRYYTGAAPGKPIIDVSSLSKAEIGTYSATMIPNEVMDLLASNLQKSGCQNVRTSDLAPAKFGSANGFKFDLAYVEQGGLEMKGEALIAQRGGKLDVLLFVAPAEYYFAHRQSDVEQLFSTIQASA